jgi:transposase
VIHSPAMMFVFRGRAGSLIKALWHDGIGLSLYASGWTVAGLSGPRRWTV